MQGPKNFLASKRRSAGLGLTEVLAALTLLGGVLVALVLERARLREQLLRADEMIEMADVADRLLASWWRDPGAIARSGEGETERGSRFSYRVETRRDESAARIGADVLRLTLENERTTGNGATLELEFLLTGARREAEER